MMRLFLARACADDHRAVFRAFAEALGALARGHRHAPAPRVRRTV